MNGQVLSEKTNCEQKLHVLVTYCVENNENTDGLFQAFGAIYKSVWFLSMQGTKCPSGLRTTNARTSPLIACQHKSSCYHKNKKNNWEILMTNSSCSLWYHKCHTITQWWLDMLNSLYGSMWQATSSQIYPTLPNKHRADCHDRGIAKITEDHCDIKVKQLWKVPTTTYILQASVRLRGKNSSWRRRVML